MKKIYSLLDTSPKLMFPLYLISTKGNNAGKLGDNKKDKNSQIFPQMLSNLTLHSEGFTYSTLNIHRNLKHTMRLNKFMHHCLVFTKANFFLYQKAYVLKTKSNYKKLVRHFK